MDFGKKFRTLTVLPFLAAVMIASALSPLTNVVVVNARGMGHEYAQPWRSKVFAGIERSVASIVSRCIALVEATCGHPLRGPAIAGLALLVAAVFAQDAAFGLVGVMGSLKLAMNKSTTLEDERRTLIRERSEVAARMLAAETPAAEDKTKLAELTAKIATVEAKIEDHKPILEAAKAAADIERDPAKTPAAATDAPSIQLGANRNLDPKQPGFFGRQLQAVHAFASHRGQVELLSPSEREILKPMAVATGLNSDVGSDGGHLVQQDRASTIIQRVYQTGEVASRVNLMPVSANSNGTVLPAIDETSRADGSRYGGIASGWLGQGNTLTAGKPKFRPMDLKLRKVGAFVYATDELLADALLLESWINKYLPLELQFRTEDAFLNGIGSNQPVGVMQSGAVITVTRNTASRILSEDLRAMVNRMWAPLWGGAAFFVDQSTLGEFDQLAVPVGTAGVLDPSYKPAGSVPGQKYATYKNIPIIPVEYCAALGTSGDIILANMNEYTAIDKGGVQQAVSMHVAFLTDEQVFRFMYRVDGQLNWNAALTPKSGGDPLSCAVILS